MGLLRFFSGPGAQKLEQQADTFFQAGSWGRAKLLYERALDKLRKQADLKDRDLARVSEKHGRAVEGLAREHYETAAGYIDGGYLNEAADLLRLAGDLTADAVFRQTVDERLAQIRQQAFEAVRQNLEPGSYAAWDDETDGETLFEASDDGYFLALCGPLPEEVRQAYLSYGETFKTGYIALNQGDFEAAAGFLEQSAAENADRDTYISLELAAAYMNLGRQTEAQSLLEAFQPRHPDALPVYQMLCDCYWEKGDFESAAALLEAIPEQWSDSLAVVRLKGENFRRSGQLELARGLYQSFMQTYGWHEAVARELADTFQHLNQPDQARALYKQILGRCTGCNTRIDPVVKHNYAELCFDAGEQGTQILELYLSLVRELPDNAPHYYDRVSRLYAAQGNAFEAERFAVFARQAERAGGNLP